LMNGEYLAHRAGSCIEPSLLSRHIFCSTLQLKAYRCIAGNVAGFRCQSNPASYSARQRKECQIDIKVGSCRSVCCSVYLRYRATRRRAHARERRPGENNQAAAGTEISVSNTVAPIRVGGDRIRAAAGQVAPSVRALSHESGVEGSPGCNLLVAMDIPVSFASIGRAPSSHRAGDDPGAPATTGVRSREI